jgi:hypothetical protein
MYKDLKLNRDAIHGALNQYASENYTNYKIQENKKNNLVTCYNFECDDKKFFLSFYFNNKGGTTIKIKEGEEQNEKEKIADYIKSNPSCLLADSKDNNRSISYKKIRFDDYNEIIDMIKTECEHCNRVLKEEVNDKQRLYKFEGKWGDKVTVNYVISTKNVRIQGRPLLLFNEISSIFNELIDESQVVKNLEQNYGEVLEETEIDRDFKQYLPNSFDKHTDKLKKSLLKAVYNLHIDSQEYTCTELTFEVLRALEGHIKLTLLLDYKVRCPNRYGTLEMFTYKELLEPARSMIADSNKIAYYEKAYRYFVVHRHKIFHWDYPELAHLDETIQYEDISEVHNIIKETLTLIDEYYTL